MDKRDKSFGSEVTSEMQVEELIAGGWKQQSIGIWKSPGGYLYHGPFQAWRHMKTGTGGPTVLQDRPTFNGDGEGSAKFTGVGFDTFGN